MYRMHQAKNLLKQGIVGIALAAAMVFASMALGLAADGINPTGGGALPLDVFVTITRVVAAFCGAIGLLCCSIGALMMITAPGYTSVSAPTVPAPTTVVPMTTASAEVDPAQEASERTEQAFTRIERREGGLDDRMFAPRRPRAQ